MEPIIDDNVTPYGSSNDNVTPSTSVNSIILNRQLVCIITGSSDGLGKVVAKMMANTNYVVILANRDLVKAKLVLDDIKETTKNNNVFSMKLDLSSFESIRNFVNEFQNMGLPLDCLINNAGIYAPPFSNTVDGFESQFQVNHLGVFLLTNLLLSKIEQSKQGRIINLSSMAHKNASLDLNDLSCKSESGYRAISRYSNSKLMTILFTRELNRILKNRNSNVITVCLHPGVIPTGLFKSQPMVQFVLALSKPFITTVNTASIAIYRLAIGSDPELPLIVGGEYFNINQLTQTTKISYDQHYWRTLWIKSAEYCKIDDIGK